MSEGCCSALRPAVERLVEPRRDVQQRIAADRTAAASGWGIHSSDAFSIVINGILPRHCSRLSRRRPLLQRDEHVLSLSTDRRDG